MMDVSAVGSDEAVGVAVGGLAVGIGVAAAVAVASGLGVRVGVGVTAFGLPLHAERQSCASTRTTAVTPTIKLTVLC